MEGRLTPGFGARFSAGAGPGGLGSGFSVVFGVVTTGGGGTGNAFPGVGAMSVLAGGFPLADGVTAPGAFPLTGLAGTPVGGVAMLGSGSGFPPGGAVTPAGGFPPGVATGAPGSVAGAPGVIVGGFPPNAGVAGVSVGGLPPAEGARGVPAGGFAPGTDAAPIGGNGLTWPTPGPVRRTGTGGGGCTGVTLRGSGGGAGGGGRNGGRPAGATPSRW